MKNLYVKWEPDSEFCRYGITKGRFGLCRQIGDVVYLRTVDNYFEFNLKTHEVTADTKGERTPVEGVEWNVTEVCEV